MKEEASAAAAHVCLVDSKDLAAAGSNAVATTARAMEASATALCTAVEAAFGGEKKVPSSSGWKDAKAAPGSGSGEWMGDDAELWMASRAFDAETQLSERIGRNEKTRITVRLQAPSGEGSPAAAEPVKKKKKMTKAEQKAAEKGAADAAAAKAAEDAAAASAAAAGGAAAAAEPPAPEVMAAARVQSSMLRSYVAETGVGARPGAAKRRRGMPDSERGDSDDEGGPRLKLAHFRMCENSEKARSLLRDERLQDVIKQIDAHESDKDRESALQERLSNDPPFAEVVDELLVSMGLARRDGSTGEVQSEA